MMYSAGSDALAAHLEGEVVLLHAGTKDYYRLNATGQVIWRMVEQGSDENGIVAALQAEYDVADAEARAEVRRILQELLDAGLVIAGA